MTAAEGLIDLAGEQMTAGLDGALLWPAAKTLIVADLHLEKASSFARRGFLLPPYDSRATLKRLQDRIAASQPRRVLCLGDSFHDGDGADRLPDEERSTLAALARKREWIWIRGNHDGGPNAALPGESVCEAAIGPLLFRHQAAAAISGAAEVSGHWHPKVCLALAGKRVSGRCFVAGRERLILPAYGAFTGGFDVRQPEIMSLFPHGYVLYVLGFRRVHRLGAGDAAGRSR
jgi:DNA ligase-associated metallophosphoesterase